MSQIYNFWKGKGISQSYQARAHSIRMALTHCAVCNIHISKQNALSFLGTSDSDVCTVFVSGYWTRISDNLFLDTLFARRV